MAFNCKSGPSELLDKGRYGLLVPVGDIHALANGLLNMVADEILRKHYSELGINRAREFDISHIIKQWVEVIEG